MLYTHWGLRLVSCSGVVYVSLRAWLHRGSMVIGPRTASKSAWPTRALQQASDWWSILTFGIPLLSYSTTLRVAERVLHVQQWSGNKVGSGGYLWGGSRRLVRYIERHGDGSPAVPPSDDGRSQGTAAVASRPLSGLTLLELGAGTGGAGLAAAVFGMEVTLTDQASFVYPGGARRNAPTHTLLDLARANVKQNAPMLLECALSAVESAAVESATVATGKAPSGVAQVHAPLPAVARLLWGEASDLAELPHAKYDVIAGADVLLFTSAHEGLLRTLRQLSSASTVVLIEHTDRGVEEDEFPLDMRHFLNLVAAEGRWTPTVVRDHGRHITIRMVCS